MRLIMSEDLLHNRSGKFIPPLEAVGLIFAPISPEVATESIQYWESHGHGRPGQCAHQLVQWTSQHLSDDGPLCPFGIMLVINVFPEYMLTLE